MTTMQRQFTREGTIFLTNDTDTTQHPRAKKKIKKLKNFDSYLIPHININSKWAIILNIKSNTVTLFEENIEENLGDKIRQRFLTCDTTSTIYKR